MKANDFFNGQACFCGDGVQVRCEFTFVADGDPYLSAHGFAGGVESLENLLNQQSHLRVIGVERVEVDQQGAVCRMQVTDAVVPRLVELAKKLMNAVRVLDAHTFREGNQYRRIARRDDAK